MEILSTVNAWQELAQISDDETRLAAWTESYEASYPSVFEVYYSAWGDTGRRNHASRQAPAQISQVRAAERRARHLLVKAENDFRAHGLLEDDELHAVLLVGVHSSNGWVADHAGRSTLFLALEFLGQPPYDDLLVVHELTHVAQMQVSPATRARTYAASLAVLVEGVATVTTRVLRPGHPDSAYLWMDADHDAWVQSCHADARAIASLLVRHADTPDDAVEVAPLFRNRSGGHVPARSGYWAGDLIARAMLQEGKELRDLLRVKPDEARDRTLSWASTTRG